MSVAVTTRTDEIAAANQALTEARLLKKSAVTPQDVAAADQLIIEALKRKRELAPRVPAKRPQPAPNAVKTIVGEAREARDERAEPVIADTLEPEVQRLLANQVLRGGALREIERWLLWLREAHAQALQQPVAAQAIMGEVIRALEIKQRDLKEASVQPSKASRANAKQEAAG